MAAGKAPLRLEDVMLTGFAHGGEAVGRLPDGKVCFVGYAAPGEHVRVAVREERARWARGEAVEVTTPHPDRMSPPCPYFGPDRCGGCQLQHLLPARQAALKRQVVAEQLERIGRFVDPPVAPTQRVADFGYRTRARFAVTEDGALAFRKPASHARYPIDHCLLLHPLAQALRERAGDAWAGVAEVSLHVGVATETTAIIVHPGPGPVPALPAGEDPVALLEDGPAGLRGVALRGDPTVVEHVAGFAFRISPASFFQAGPAAAEALVGLVREAAAIAPGDRAADLYAGVGLFSRALAADGADVVAVEASEEAAEDALANLAEVETDAAVLVGQVAEGLEELVGAGERIDVVVCDPPRAGLGAEVVAGLAALTPRTVVAVSCDPAALARDARGLVEAGYTLERVTPVDAFAQTAEIEAVAVFHRA